jgi:hypothetical protein
MKIEAEGAMGCRCQLKGRAQARRQANWGHSCPPQHGSVAFTAQPWISSSGHSSVSSDSVCLYVT